jgi:protease I
VSRTEAHAGVFLLDGFQELEFWYPVLRFREEGIRVTVIGHGEATTFSRLGYPVAAEAGWSAVPNDCTLLLVPGEHAPNDATTLGHLGGALRAGYGRGASVAAVGASVGLLGSAGLLRGVQVAAPEALKATLSAQGAVVSELTVCADRRVLTACGADDLPQFFQALLVSMSEEKRSESV